jgi:hypothetical protein
MATTTVSLTIDDAVLAAARTHARDAGMSLSAWVTDAMDAATLQAAARALADWHAGHPGVDDEWLAMVGEDAATDQAAADQAESRGLPPAANA